MTVCFVSLGNLCQNPSRLTVFTGERVDLQFLANDYIDKNGFSNMTKTFSAKTAGVNCYLQSNAGS